MPDQLPTIRIFISSPADVWPERLKAEQIAPLDREFTCHFRVEAVLWERQPLVAAAPLPGPGEHLAAARHRHRCRHPVGRGSACRNDQFSLAPDIRDYDIGFRVAGTAN